METVVLWIKKGIKDLLVSLLSHTRPDIAYLVSVVSQHINDSNEDHMEAMKRILRYLKMTPGHGLPFRKSAKREVKIYTDASWAGKLTDRRPLLVIAHMFGVIL